MSPRQIASIHLTLLIALALVAGCARSAGSIALEITFPKNAGQTQPVKLSLYAIVPGADGGCDPLREGISKPGDEGYDVIEAQAELDTSQSSDAVELSPVNPGLRLFFIEGMLLEDGSAWRGCQALQVRGGRANRIAIAMEPFEVIILPPPRRMFWADAGPPPRIMSALLDGTEVKNLGVTGMISPNAVAVDSSAGKIYWADSGASNVRRANLDGSAAEVIVEPFCAGTPWGVTLSTADHLVYYADTSTGCFKYVDLGNLNGWCTYFSGVGEGNPRWVHIESSFKDIYWSNPKAGGGTIYRMTLASSYWFQRVTGVADPAGLAVDTQNGILYFAETGAGRLRRASVSGLNAGLQDVVTGLGQPTGLALDLGAGNIYWTDPGTKKIQRAKLDGSGVEDLVTVGLVNPQGIALE